MLLKIERFKWKQKEYRKALKIAEKMDNLHLFSNLVVWWRKKIWIVLMCGKMLGNRQTEEVTEMYWN